MNKNEDTFLFVFDQKKIFFSAITRLRKKDLMAAKRCEKRKLENALKALSTSLLDANKMAELIISSADVENVWELKM